MSENEFVERSVLENRRVQLRSRHDKLDGRFRPSLDEIESYAIRAEMFDVGRALSNIREALRQLDAQPRAFQSSPCGRNRESTIMAGCLTLESARHGDEFR